MASIDIPAKVKESVLSVAPDADVILYGSRVRGVFDPDSDWDFLVLCANGEDRAVKNAIHDAVIDLEFEIGPLCDTWPSISVFVHSREYWSRGVIRATPYHREVSRDGKRL
ncbi:MAG: hypothetical protein RLZZ303_496 [Candidatus Hydrogenedentota bacterium]|jgi:predicted nucleotidyltransferase